MTEAGIAAMQWHSLQCVSVPVCKPEMPFACPQATPAGALTALISAHHGMHLYQMSCHHAKARPDNPALQRLLNNKSVTSEQFVWHVAAGLGQSQGGLFVIDRIKNGWQGRRVDRQTD